MRVIAGELGGRRLLEPPAGAALRPTADRVREALFSILGPVARLRVLDLFCGSGALAIEAISRGAASAVLVDERTDLAARNVAALGIEDRCRIVAGDVAAVLRRERSSFDLVFCDPPYRLAGRLGPTLDNLLAGRLAAGARVIAEFESGHPLELSLPLETERRYGRAGIRVHRADR